MQVLSAELKRCQDELYFLGMEAKPGDGRGTDFVKPSQLYSLSKVFKFEQADTELFAMIPKHIVKGQNIKPIGDIITDNGEFNVRVIGIDGESMANAVGDGKNFIFGSKPAKLNNNLFDVWKTAVLEKHSWEDPSQMASALKRTILNWVILNDWYKDLDNMMEFTMEGENEPIGIKFQSVDFFGPNIGFLKFVANFTNRDALIHLKKNPRLPGSVFMRSAAVAVLPVITVENELIKYTLVTVQARVPAGITRFTEIPAGMMDEKKNFGGNIAKEMKDQTGIVVPEKDMFCLTDWAYAGTGHKGMYPSVGGCNEYLKLYAWETSMGADEFKDLLSKTNDRTFGEESEGELIRIRVIPLDSLAKEAPDAKSLSALALYDRYTKARKESKRFRVSRQMLNTLRDIEKCYHYMQHVKAEELKKLWTGLSSLPEWQLSVRPILFTPGNMIDGLSSEELDAVRELIGPLVT